MTDYNDHQIWKLLSESRPESADPGVYDRPAADVITKPTRVDFAYKNAKGRSIPRLSDTGPSSAVLDMYGYDDNNEESNYYEVEIEWNWYGDYYRQTETSPAEEPNTEDMHVIKVLDHTGDSEVDISDNDAIVSMIEDRVKGEMDGESISYMTALGWDYEDEPYEETVTMTTAGDNYFTDEEKKKLKQVGKDKESDDDDEETNDEGYDHRLDNPHHQAEVRKMKRENPQLAYQRAVAKRDMGIRLTPADEEEIARFEGSSEEEDKMARIQRLRDIMMAGDADYNMPFEETNHEDDRAALAPGDKRQKDGSVTDKDGKVVYKPKPRHPKGGVPYSDGKGEHDSKHIDKLPSEVKEGAEGSKTDREKADVDGDKEIEPWEKARANAIRKAQGKTHLCAKTVNHENYGPGATVHGHHAIPDVNGNIEWYVVEFKHGKEKVYTEDLEVVFAVEHSMDESHNI